MAPEETFSEEDQYNPSTPPPVVPPMHQHLDYAQMDVSPVAGLAAAIRQELAKVIVGQHDLIELLIAALLSGGHVLIEGVPGIAKTLTAKLMARTMQVGFSRIQFTPDLMPSDVVGTSVFNMKISEFTFNAGPIFSNFVLIDEINRAPAKTQAALFEVMEEYQVTVDGTTYPMEFPFFVMATQNPIEQEGTYKLPEAQLDRFIFKINIDYPSLEDERQILHRFKSDFQSRAQEEVMSVCTSDQLRSCRSIVEKIHIKQDILDYIAQLVHQTRNHGDLFLGASPRASLALLRASKALAAMNNRDYVTPDDLRQVAFPVLNHRIILTPEREMEGLTTKAVIDTIIQKIEVPR